MSGRKLLLLITGWLAVALGAVGAFLPVVPTVPFLLVAAYCFSRSSPRLHAWLVSHPRFGAPILDWQEHGVIRPRAKRLATALILVSSVFPLRVVPLPSPVRVAVAATLIGVLAFIWTRPSRPGSPARPGGVQKQKGPA